jgi:hypothetical protein
MDLDSPKWTTKIYTSIENYGLHQMALPVKVHILELEPWTPLNNGLFLKSMDFIQIQVEFLIKQAVR